MTASSGAKGRGLGEPNMMFWSILIWVIGLLTYVPFGTYYLFVHANRDEYAFLITSILFWIFGYWGVVGPIVAAIKVRSVFKRIERAQEQGNLQEVLQSPETRDVAIEFVASENKIPKFLAAKIVRLLAKRLLVEKAASSDGRGPERSEDGF